MFSMPTLGRLHVQHVQTRTNLTLTVGATVATANLDVSV
jgi:hypothetical protein